MSGRFRVLLILAGALAAAPAKAAISVTAEVDKSAVALNDQVALTVTVTGPATSLPEPKLPELPNFSVYSANTSQSFSFVNGQVSSSNQYTYVLVPHFVGKGAIGPISVTYDGQTAQTQPIEIQVGAPGGSGPSSAVAAAPRPQAAAPAPGTPQIFVTAEVDKKKAYVNEQVMLTVKFFTAVNLLGNPQYSAPDTTGFLAEDLPPERHGTVSLHGRNYYFSEIRTALFPTQAGRLPIGAATIRCQVQQNVAMDPFAPDFFQKFFQGGGIAPETRDLRSDPLIVEVLPLPAQGKPAQFSGAVGQFSLSAAADRASAKVGDAVTLTVTVAGAGNLKSIASPGMPPLTDFRAYDTVIATNLDKRNDRIQGAKTFKTVLVPRVSGDLTIPGISFDYFDSSARAYRRATTSPIRVKVAPGEAGGGGINFAQAGAASPQGLSAVSQDIRYLKTRPDRPVVSSALAALADARWLNLFPFLLFAGIFGADQYERLESLDPRKRRRRAALKSAARRLERARSIGQPRQAAALLGEALSHYLADKLDQPALGLTLKRALESLPALPPPLSQRLRSVWEDLDLRQFAPVAGDGAGETAQAAAQLDSLLQDLEKEIGK